ncbi:MAG: glycerophosphodiester phosphodiesterase family protein [Myxococcota bacterium]
MLRAPAWVTACPVAHRGLHDDRVPENSLAAFEAACEAGVPLELDVHASADGHAIVFHDDTLARMTGAEGRVGAHTAKQLARFRLGSSQEHIPTLADVLARVRGRVPIVVEVKNEGRVGLVERAVERVLSGYRGDVAVQSFNPLTLAWFRREMPDLPRGLLAGDMDELDMNPLKQFALERLLLTPHARPAYIGYDLRALPIQPATLLRRLGMPLLAWTVRTEADQARAFELADNYIFENVSPTACPN